MPDELNPPDEPNARDEQHGFIPHAPPIAETRESDVMAGSVLASFGKRLAGYLLDGLIVYLPCILVARVALGAGKHSNATLFVVGAIPTVVSVIYAWLMLTYAGGQTLGMKAVRVRCIDAASGQSVTSGRAAGRCAAWFVFSAASLIIFIPLLLDLLWPLWDKENQTLHDKIASTLVVNAPSF